eukprot:scaffold5287_cov59-Attheya_sp.AAC.6
MRISAETCAILCVCIGTSLLLSVQAQIGSDIDNVEEPATGLVERSLRARVRRRRNKNRGSGQRVRGSRERVVQPYTPEIPEIPKIQAYRPWVCGTNWTDARERCGSTGVSIPKCEYEGDVIEPMVKPCWAQCDFPYSAAHCNTTGEDEEIRSCQEFIPGCDGYF